MDIITFIVIAIIVYSIFSKKDKPPQRRSTRQEDNQPLSGTLTDTPRKKSRNLFEDLERQFHEVEQRYERQLRGDNTETRGTVKPASQTGNKNAYSVTREDRRIAAEEGNWGDEGRSDYDKYVSVQGTQGTEGVGGTEGFSDSEGFGDKEGIGGAEGTWGSEGVGYAKNQAAGQDLAEEKQAVSAPVTQAKRPAFNLALSSSEVTRGVIWAEVLNEPRARRPYHRRWR